MSVKIIVDSTADLTPRAKAGVAAIVPLTIRFGEEEYKDGVTITPQRFYEMLASCQELPTTSQPTPMDFEDVYRAATADGSQVVAITISSRLSGTYQSATIAADEFDGQVVVVDSRSAALGNGILAEYALELAEKGLDAQQILEELMEKRQKLHLLAMVDTLEYLKKGGRLNAAVATVGGMLNLKPIICLEDGSIATLGKVRGVKKAFAQLTQECENYGGPDRSMPMMLGYTGCSDENLRQYQQAAGEYWDENIPTSVVGATIGVHAGPGAVAIAFFGA